jgi:hypothetical protein
MDYDEDGVILMDNKATQADYDRADKVAEMQKKNHDFVQFTRKGMTALTKLRNGTAHALFHYLAKEMARDNSVIVSQETLAEILETSRSSITLAVRDLENLDLIQIIKVGNANVYCMNAEIVWTQERDKLHLARFKANVIVSKAEQAKMDKVKVNRMKQVSLI